jgi:F0F1-type ATP synthase epsilon subunit
MKFVLISDEVKIFHGEVQKISCCSENGPFTIMNGHIPYMSKIKDSISWTKIDESTKSHEIKEGFIYTNGEICFAVVDAKD